MANKDNKIMRRRLANAYLSSVISISLVLLLVGVASMLLVNAKSVSDYFKENMQVSVMMKQDVSEDDALKYMKKLEGETFIKSLDFISKEQGQQEIQEPYNGFAEMSKEGIYCFRGIGRARKERRTTDGLPAMVSKSAAPVGARIARPQRMQRMFVVEHEA